MPNSSPKLPRGCDSPNLNNRNPSIFSIIEKTKDLVGKTVAVPSGIGGSDQNITMRFLLRDGIDPVNGVKYKVTDQGAAVLAMQNGEIEAGLFSDQFIQKFLKDGTLRVVRSITTDDDFKNETCCIYAVAKDLCENSWDVYTM